LEEARVAAREAVQEATKRMGLVLKMPKQNSSNEVSEAKNYSAKTK
jgi:hypothetical protein